MSFYHMLLFCLCAAAMPQLSGALPDGTEPPSRALLSLGIGCMAFALGGYAMGSMVTVDQPLLAGIVALGVSITWGFGILFHPAYEPKGPRHWPAYCLSFATGILGMILPPVILIPCFYQLFTVLFRWLSREKLLSGCLGLVLFLSGVALCLLPG